MHFWINACQMAAIHSFVYKQLGQHWPVFFLLFNWVEDIGMWGWGGNLRGWNFFVHQYSISVMCHRGFKKVMGALGLVCKMYWAFNNSFNLII